MKRVVEVVAPGAPNEWRTADLYFSAFLVASELGLTKTERENGRTFFYFPTGDRLDQLRVEWMNGRAQVIAPVFANAIKMLKAQVHSP